MLPMLTADPMLRPSVSSKLRHHNRRAVAARYSMPALTHSFQVGLDILAGRAGDRE